MTPFVLTRGFETFDYTFSVRPQKLDLAVDRELAASDPQFHTYLEHWNESAREVGGGVQYSDSTSA